MLYVNYGVYGEYTTRDLYCILQVIKNWTVGRPGNKAKGTLANELLLDLG